MVIPAPVVNPWPVATPVPVVNESFGGSNGNILVIAISAVAVISYIRKMASNVKEQTPEGIIPTAVAIQIDPETAEAPTQALDPFSTNGTTMSISKH